MSKIIDGKALASVIKEELKAKTEKMVKEGAKAPGLALLIVGNNPASMTYVRSKDKTCKDLGFHSIIKYIEEDAKQEEVLSYIEKWNNDDSIHGILVQLPLPKQIDENQILLAINPDKDVDGFHPMNVGNLVAGLPGYVPCTPAGIMEMIKRYNIHTSGKHVVVVGRSNIVGKPIANLLYQKTPHANATVTICHTGSIDFARYTKQADILIAAMGSPLAINSEHIKEGVIIIDVGINRISTNNEKGYKIVGDVDFDDVFDKVDAITPVPGGVGAMTIAMLMDNTYKAAIKLQKL